MNVKCNIHGTEMKLVPSGTSKKTGKNYQAFMACLDYTCKETAPAANVDPEEQMDEFVKDLDADMKHEAQQKLDQIEAKRTKTVEDKPMTSSDWNIKGYEKSWGVFSSSARKEGASPKEAIDTMHLWQWVDSVHGDEPGYQEWKEGVNRRVKKQ